MNGAGFLFFYSPKPEPAGGNDQEFFSSRRMSDARASAPLP
jgi:hypothetical protein